MCEILVGTSFVLQFENAGSLHHSLGKEICIHLFYSRESEYLVVCPRLLHIKTTRMNVQSFVDTYFVIQFENGGCLHNVNLSPARVFTGHDFLWFCKRLEFKSISLMSVQNSIFIGEVFQIELSDGQVHPLGSRQIVNLCPTRAFTGTRVFMFL